MIKKEDIEYLIQPQRQLSINFKELWQYRELFYFFAWRDIKVKYKQTVLGFLWVVLQPLLITFIFVIFFSNTLKIPTDDIPAPVFYFSGLIFWNLFNFGVTNAANSMINNAHIIKKVYFPRLIIPVSSFLSVMVDFFMTISVFFVLIFYYSLNELEICFSKMTVCFMLAFILTSIFTTGMGILIASLNVKYRDFRYVIPFLIQFLFFVTPVIFPISVVSSPILKVLLNLNPMSGVITISRAGISIGEIDWMIVYLNFGISIVVLFIGLFNFRKTESYYADLV